MLLLDEIRALLEDTGEDDLVPVTGRWLQQALAELEAAREGLGA